MAEKKGDNRSRASIWMDALKRAYIWRFAAQKKGIILVTEYPKSGGTWVGQMLSHYTDLPFPRNKMPNIEPSILHGHRAFHPSFKNVVCVIRDGRDAMVSAYYHYFFLNDKNNDVMVAKMREKMPFTDFDDVKANMPYFIEFLFDYKPGAFFNENWSEFNRSWYGKNAAFVHYEKLLSDPVAELTPAVEKLTGKKVNVEKLKEAIDAYSFENVTKRKPGEESASSFIRKGIAGDWKNVFTKEACVMFDKFGGEELILLGYEKDRSWIEQASVAE